MNLSEVALRVLNDCFVFEGLWTVPFQRKLSPSKQCVKKIVIMSPEDSFKEGVQ